MYLATIKIDAFNGTWTTCPRGWTTLCTWTCPAQTQADTFGHLLTQTPPKDIILPLSLVCVPGRTIYFSKQHAKTHGHELFAFACVSFLPFSTKKVNTIKVPYSCLTLATKPFIACEMHQVTVLSIVNTDHSP